MRNKFVICLSVAIILLIGWIHYDTRIVPCETISIFKCIKGKTWLAYTKTKMRVYWLTHPKEEKEFQNTFIKLGESLKEFENTIDKIDIK